MIVVASPGMFTTVQDLGRYGYGPLGVSPSGAADPLSLRLANLLVGNPETAAGLEMTLVGGTFIFPDGGLIAAAGSDFGATVNGAPWALFTVCSVLPGQTVKFGPTRTGARCYLAIRGGIEVKPFLGSASTHALTHLGGLDGRALRKGDALTVRKTRAKRGKLKDDAAIVPEKILNLCGRRPVLRTTVAPQTDLFSRGAVETFYKGEYRVTEQSNRMGLRLAGPAIEAPCSGHMVTEGVSLGALQVPADGQPIILFVEQQTTGGYPKIANVIAADLPSVGQLRPNDVIRFELLSAEMAQSAIREQERMLHKLALNLSRA